MKESFQNKINKIRKLSVIIILVFLQLQISGQNLKKGFNKLKEKNYTQALIIAKQNTKIPKDKIPAFYLLLKSQLNIGLKNRTSNLKLYIQTIEQNLNKSTDEQKKYWQKKYAFQPSMYYILKQQIEQKLSDSLMNQLNPKLANEFILLFPENKQLDKIIYQRDSCLYQITVQENTFEAFNEFINNYPESIFTPQAKSIIKNTWLNRYHQFQREGELSPLIAFKDYYPQFPYQETLKKDIENAQLADKLKLTKPYDSLKYSLYIKYLKTAKTDLNIIVLQKLMEKDIRKNNWEQAMDTLAKYFKFIKHQKEAMQTARVLKHYPNNVKIEKWPSNVNTYANEYGPLLSANGKTLYFCSLRRKENLGGEDIFFTQMNNNGQWSKVRLLPGINTRSGNEAPESITADEKTIVLFSGREGGKLIYLEKNYYGWSSSKEFEGINSPYFEGEASLSADGKVLLFVSDRIDNYGLYHKRNLPFHGGLWGNSDIYLAIKSLDGKWHEIKHLDSLINTPYAELSPFLHPDMKTLYFSSNGHGGLGGLDVFKTTRLYDSSWVYWSKPISLGKEINTEQDDWGYKVSSDGTFAYFAQRKQNNFDIYTATLPKNLKPEPISTIYGKLPQIGQNKTSGKIFWKQENESGFGEYVTDFEGNFTILLPQGKNYTLYTEIPGFYIPPIETNIQENTPALKIEFKPIPIDSLVGKNIELKHIYFDYNKATLKQESYEELEIFTHFLTQNKNIIIEIIGHTDSIGTITYNQQLSEKRAQNIALYLTKNGIEKNRLKAIGMGESAPLKQNENKQSKNRRVEFRIISN